MRPAFTICGLACAVVFATAGAEARAAFIAPGAGLSQGASADVSASQEASPMQNRPEDFATPDRPGQPNSRFYSRTGRGMTSTSTTVPRVSGTTSVAVPATKVQLTGGRLVMRWEREGACKLPPPHLAGVFRPPRFDAF